MARYYPDVSTQLYDISTHSMQTLHKENWLNDDVINAIMAILQYKDKSSIYFNTFFYSILEKESDTKI